MAQANRHSQQAAQFGAASRGAVEPFAHIPQTESPRAIDHGLDEGIADRVAVQHPQQGGCVPSVRRAGQTAVFIGHRHKHKAGLQRFARNFRNLLDDRLHFQGGGQGNPGPNQVGQAVIVFTPLPGSHQLDGNGFNRADVAIVKNMWFRRIDDNCPFQAVARQERDNDF